ncbi:hypothetical protein MPSEU_000329400 [Mayamaea pseudoterrestris]|nr:hypothetical protein MPSEU_000329400 [Mayamaea pseudoterrestris]
MEQVVRARAGLTDEQVAALAAAGVNNANDLSSLTFEDIREILPAPTGILIVRRLASISKFVARGQALTPLTTMAMINSYNDLQERAPPAAAPPAAAAAADPSRSALKLSVNPMDEFSGLHSDWEVWYIETEATLRQTTFSGLLDQGPPEGNAALQVRNKEFYAMLIRAVHTGFAQHLVTKIKEQDGHAAWEALKEWYGSGETSSTLIDHHRNKLKNAVCDEDHSASEYINTFILSTDKLSELGEAMTDHTKKADFLAGITDPDYEIDIRNLKARANTTFNDIVHAIRKREQDIAVEASQRQRGETGSSRTKARRATNGGEGKSSNNAKIPFIPPLVMSYFTDSNAKKALIVWRTIWNEERRMPRADELPSRDGDDRVGSGADHNTGSASTRKSGKGKKVKGGARTRRTSATTVDGGAPDSTKASAGVVKTRLTKTASRGLKDSTVVVRIKDSDDEGSTSTASDDDGNMDDTKDTHESSAAKTARASRKRKAKGKKKLANSVKDSKEKKPKKTRRNPRSRRGRSTDRPRAIIDPGSEVHIIGGVGWEVISQVNKSTQVDGALPGMVGQKLPFVCALWC